MPKDCICDKCRLQDPKYPDRCRTVRPKILFGGGRQRLWCDEVKAGNSCAFYERKSLWKKVLGLI